MDEENEPMVLKEAAARVGIKANVLRQAINRNNLVATKKGRDWFVTLKAINDWQKNKPHKPGRPKSGA